MSVEALSRKLRKARLDKKLKLSELKDKTKIQLEFLKKMENGEFDVFPKPVIIGFIKSIALIVEVDESGLIALYYAEFEKPTVVDNANQNKVQSVFNKQNNAKIIKEAIKELEESKVPNETIVSKEIKKPKKKTAKSKITVQEKEGQKPGIEKSSKLVAKPPKSKDKKSLTWFSEHKGELILGTLVLLILAGIIYVYIQYISKENVNSSNEPVEKITVFEARRQNLEKAETEKPEIELNRIPEKVELRVVAAE